jgi:hypothetical protein
MMRPAVLLILAVLIAAIWAFDAFEYDGQYSAAAWDTVKHQADKLDHEVENWLGGNGR